MKKQDRNSSSLTAVLVKLLQGFVLSDDTKAWEALLTYQEQVREYFSQLGLQLHLSMDDGYAFLKPGMSNDESDQNESQESEEKENAPNLVRRFPLSFEVSLLCVLLREALEQFDSKVNDDHRLILHRADIYDQLKLFYEEKTDETKQMKRFDAMINKVIELGFLKELKGNQNSFEVRRIIKALIDAEKLAEMKMKMMIELGHSADRKADGERS